ncbi:MAG: ATP-binding protein, partial [Opitutaceae bacterium]
HENASAAGYFDEIHQTATNITRAMDEIVWVVNPNYDHLESLAAYIGDFAQKFLALAGIRCRLDIPPELPPIPVTSQVRHHLFLCCKEALNNVVKHAQADEVVLSIHSSDQQFVITIRDNGHGGDFAAINNSTNGRQAARVVAGLGLDGMKQRMAAINGKFEVSVPRGGGTTVRLTMLFAAEER